MKKCIGLAGALFGHRLEARYSYGPLVTDVETRAATQSILRMIEASKEKVYKGDICTRCGYRPTMPSTTQVTADERGNLIEGPTS